MQCDHPWSIYRWLLTLDKQRKRLITSSFCIIVNFFFLFSFYHLREVFCSPTRLSAFFTNQISDDQLGVRPFGNHGWWAIFGGGKLSQTERKRPRPNRFSCHDKQRSSVRMENSKRIFLYLCQAMGSRLQAPAIKLQVHNITSTSSPTTKCAMCHVPSINGKVPSLWDPPWWVTTREIK